MKKKILIIAVLGFFAVSALVIHHKLINHPINWDEQEATRPIATGFMFSSS